MALYQFPYRIQHRRGTYTELYARNEVLLEGEECFETHDASGAEQNPPRCKVGDGSTPWNDLVYADAAPPAASVDTAQLVDDAVTYAKIQNVSAASRLLGRGASGAGDPEEITLGAGLTISGTSLQASGGVGGVGMSFIGQAIVAGSPATSLTLSGLNLSVDQCYYMLFAMDNATASAANVSLFFNGDATATNYYSQFLTGDGTAANAARNNNAFICSLSANETNTGYFFMRNDLDGKPRTLTISNREAPAAMRIQFANHVWNSATNVTSITLSSSVANALAVGTTFKIFKVTS